MNKSSWRGRNESTSFQIHPLINRIHHVQPQTYLIYLYYIYIYTYIYIFTYIYI